MLSIIDVSLVPLRKSSTFKTVIPSKIFESSGMRKPILLGVEGQAKDLLDKYNAGLCFEPENENDFKKCIYKIRSNRGLYQKLQSGCAKLASDFDRKKLAQDMYAVIEEVARSGK